MVTYLAIYNLMQPAGEWVEGTAGHVPQL